MAEFVQGFINSVRMTEFGLALNFHLKTSCIISRSYEMLHHLVGDLARVRNLETDRLDFRQMRDVNKIIKHLKFYTKHSKNKITYTVDGIVPIRPSEHIFKQKDGTDISIAAYFKKEYKINVKSYPLVKTTGKARYLPLDLAFLVDKQFLSNSKIDSNVQRELLMKSTHSPNVYFDKLEKIVGKVSGIDPALQKSFGIKSICPMPAQFTGRVLPVPRTVEGSRGTFYSPGNAPTKWGVFCFTEQGTAVNLEHLKNFVQSMRAKARQLNLNFVSEPTPISPVVITNKNDISAVFANLQKRTNCELIFVGIPTCKLSH